jgi:hypothetical protein
VLVPVVICFLCLFAGAWATARWLPDLALGPEGSLALIAICGLLGMALATVGLHVYLIVEGLEQTDAIGHGTLVAGELTSMLWEAGALLGLALIVFLMSPRLDPRDQSPSPAEIDAPA